MSRAGRKELERWQAAGPRNFYEASPNLAHTLRAHLGDISDLEPGLRAFGAAVAQVVDPVAYKLERDGPQAHGEAVRFAPAYAHAGRVIWASGLLSAPPFEQAALFYLLSHAGEAGHGCPVACTAGLIRALRLHGSQELRDTYLPPLLEPDYARSQRGSQFLTEAQGGSDVGTNAVRAVREGDAWRISGEKWFCSVADADQFVVTARVDGAAAGTRGIGCFLVPRVVDGSPNGFRLRRLKDKLGTRAMATGEIEFDGALGHSIGPVEDGFRVAVGTVLNTSRWINALGSTGLMRRAFLVAASFSDWRRAFGRRIAEFPLVRENLAVMQAEEHAALASTFELTALVDSTDADDIAYHRFLVNANKFSTSLAATRVVRRAIEALGGNGTIEDFSPLPRLYRDAIVFESWEGTHNVLCAQVLRDLARLGTLELVLERSRGVDSRVDAALEEAGSRIRRSLDEPDEGALHFRRQLDALVRAIQAACLVRLGDEAVAELHIKRHLVPGYEPEDDRGYGALLQRALAGESAATAVR